MTPDRTFETELTEEEYEQITDKYITIPPGASGVEAEGDSIRLDVQAGVADWKQQGVSLTIPLTVVTPGINVGKTIDWYAGIKKDAMGITKKGLKAFGVEDKVIVREGGKVSINPLGFESGVASALFRRELSNQGNLRSVLDSTSFLPVGAKAEATAEELIPEPTEDAPF